MVIFQILFSMNWAASSAPSQLFCKIYLSSYLSGVFFLISGFGRKITEGQSHHIISR